jgi:hypothetical protein
MEGKLALVYLLKIMVEHEGRLSGRYELLCLRNIVLTHIIVLKLIAA